VAAVSVAEGRSEACHSANAGDGMLAHNYLVAVGKFSELQQRGKLHMQKHFQA